MSQNNQAPISDELVYVSWSDLAKASEPQRDVLLKGADRIEYDIPEIEVDIPTLEDVGIDTDFLYDMFREEQLAKE